MSRKVCKRKVWATKGFDAVAHAIAGCLITNKASLDAMQVRELSALESITRGSGTLQDWCDLKDASNVCTVAATMGVGPEALPSCAVAQECLLQAARRFEATGKMGLTGEGITALRDVIEYLQLQRQSMPRSQYEQIIRKTINRIKSNAPEVVEI